LISGDLNNDESEYVKVKHNLSGTHEAPQLLIFITTTQQMIVSVAILLLLIGWEKMSACVLQLSDYWPSFGWVFIPLLLISSSLLQIERIFLDFISQSDISNV